MGSASGSAIETWFGAMRTNFPTLDRQFRSICNGDHGALEWIRRANPCWITEGARGRLLLSQRSFQCTERIAG